MKIKNIAQYEETDSELAKYTICDLQNRINEAIENLQIGIDTYNNGGSRTSLFECISDSIDILEGKNGNR